MVNVRIIRKKHREIPKISGPLRVKAGYPASESSQTIVMRAIWNHFGTKRGIPARPFLRNAMRGNLGKYRQQLKTAAPLIIKGLKNTHNVLSRLGIQAVGDIQKSITSLRTPPNAPSTIARKGSSNPLIDTGEMRQSTTYVVE